MWRTELWCRLLHSESEGYGSHHAPHDVAGHCVGLSDLECGERLRGAGYLHSESEGYSSHHAPHDVAGHCVGLSIG